MTPEQFREHIKLLENIRGENKGTQQRLEELIPIVNKNLQVVGESKEVLEEILDALKK